MLREEVLESRGASATSEGDLERCWRRGAVSGREKMTWRAPLRVPLLAVKEDEGESGAGACVVGVCTRRVQHKWSCPE